MNKVYVINGDPVPLLRPRFSRYTQRVYNSQKNTMLVASIDLQSQHNQLPFFKGALHLDITFFMAPSKSLRLSKKQIFHGKPHIFRPDLSNLIKFVEDIANGVLYEDDCIISSITAKKVYDIIPRTEFTIQSAL